MKNVICFCTLSSLFSLMSCHKEVPVPLPAPAKNVFSILPTSSSCLAPYQGKDTLVFEDSLGNLLTLKVKAYPNTTDSLLILYPDASVAGGVGSYSYFSTGDRIVLTDDANQYTFNVEVFPQVVGTKPDPIQNFDALLVKMKESSYQEYSSIVFFKVIDFKDDISYKNSFVETNITEPSKVIFGTTFYDVQHMDISSSYALVYFNKTYGIVAFTDHSNKRWRLKI
jgi:hypothetical protein